MNLERCITFAAGAACFDGHFAGRPVVPGVMLLGHAERLLNEAGWRLLGVQRCKFLRCVGPDQPVVLRLRWPAASSSQAARVAQDADTGARAEQTVRFEVEVHGTQNNGTIIASGVLNVAIR